MQQILSISDHLAPLQQAARKSAGLSQTELACRLASTAMASTACSSTPTG